jgi:hypothetical protein
MYDATQIETLSYYLRKRYADLLNTVADTEGNVRQSNPNSEYVFMGGAPERHRTQGVRTQADDLLPEIGDDETFGPENTGYNETTYLYYQRRNHATAVPDATTINTMGILYWTTPDLKIGPISETDLRDTLADHCLTQMLSGDEVGTYRVSSAMPNTASGITGGWVDQGSFYHDQIYDATINDGGTNVDYRLWLKTANTTEPTSPDNYIRWDDSNSEIQLENSTISSSLSKIFHDVYGNIILRRHLLYDVSATNSGTHRGTFSNKVWSSQSDVLSGPSAPPSPVYTRTYTPEGTLVDGPGTATFYFVSPGQRTP